MHTPAGSRRRTTLR